MTGSTICMLMQEQYCGGIRARKLPLMPGTFESKWQDRDRDRDEMQIKTLYSTLTNGYEILIDERGVASLSVIIIVWGGRVQLGRP